MNKTQIHASYLRLLDAARMMKPPLKTASEVGQFLTQNGLAVSPQMLTNWKNRGISRDLVLDVARIMGLVPEWLRDGIGPQMTQSGLAAINLSDQKLQESSANIQQAAIRLLSTMDIDDAHIWLETIRAEANKARRSNQEKRVHGLTTRDPPHEVGHATSSSSPRRHARKSSSRG